MNMPVLSSAAVEQIQEKWEPVFRPDLRLSRELERFHDSTNRENALVSRGFNERRVVERRRCFKGALLRFNGGYGALECVVKNFSAGGARLSFGEAVAVPPRFDLRIGQEGGWHPAVIKWRKGNEIGIGYE